MKLLRILFVFLISIAIGCGESTSKVEKALKDQILYFGNGTEPKDLDPHTVTGVPESHILMALLEGLVIRHPKGLDPLPGVAKSWIVSPDGKTYTFTLRDSAVWSNGDAVTASDFVYAWKRMLTPSLGSKYPDMLYDVVNAEDFNKGKIEDFNEVGVKALNSKTLIVNLENPAPYFLGLLGHYTTRPVHKPTIQKFGEIDTIGSQWTRPGNFVGNGPFTLEEWKLNKVLKVKKNKLYWNADKVKLNEIHFFPVDNASREDLISVEQGEIDVISQFLPQQLNEVDTEKLIEKIISENNFSTLKDMGGLMSNLKNSHMGSIDMALAGKIAKSKLS